MRYKKSIIFFSLFFSCLQIFTGCLEQIEKKHRPVVSKYMKLSGQMSLYNNLELQDLFKVASEVDPKYLKTLRKDIAVLKKEQKRKKKKKESFEVEKNLIFKLEKIYKFLKKYYFEIEALHFIDQVHSDWGNIIKAVDKGEDILPLLKGKGISKTGVKGLKQFIYVMNQLLYKVDYYENKLHSDFIDLKLSNYVLKIELIRIRNAAIFHPLYRGMPIVTSYPR